MTKLTSLGGVSLTNKPDPFAWDIAKAEIFLTEDQSANLLSTNTTITTISHHSIYVANADSVTGTLFNSPHGIVMCPNGTTFYVAQLQGVAQGYIQKYNMKLKNFVGKLNQNVNGEALVFGNSVVYVGNASLTNMSSIRGLRFSTNGHCFYVVEDTQNSIKQYNCSTPFEALTSTYRANSAVLDGGSSPLCFEWKSDGTKIFVSHFFTTKINEYTLSEAWNVETISYRTQITYPSSITHVQGLKFKKNGKTLFLADSTGPKVWQYSLTEAWNVETLNTTAVANTHLGYYNRVLIDIDFDQSQRYFYTLDSTYDTIVQYSFAANKGLDLIIKPKAIHFSSDGTKLYSMTSGGKVSQFNIPEPWNSDTGVIMGSKNANTMANEPTGDFWFKPDGTKFYTYARGARINEWNMSELWNVQSASLGSNTLINTTTSTFVDLWTWKPDGTKFYVVDTQSITAGGLQEYSLSTPWDITTTSWSANGPNVNFLSTRNLPAVQANFIQRMYWHPNGKILYVYYDSPYFNFSKFNFSESWNVLTFTSWSNNYASNRNDVGPMAVNMMPALYVRPDGKILYTSPDDDFFLRKYRFSGYEFPDGDYTNI